jgi:16S rRNA G966 N2-methylase RsmD
VWITPVTRAVRLLAARGETFDLIFLDPPSEQRLIDATLKAIGSGRLVRGSGLAVAEHSVREPAGPRYPGLVLTDRRRYGSTVLSFYRSESSDPLLA